LTLPEDVIATLRSIDSDLSVAVVRAMQPMAQNGPKPPAELATYGDRAVIVVPRSRELRDRTGVELVPMSDGRALLAFDDRLSVAQFELRLLDALDDPNLNGEHRAIFESVAEIIGDARRDDGVEMRQRQILELRWKPGQPAIEA
jgi:hypothetical protein